jgi:hypothetical protein
VERDFLFCEGSKIAVQPTQPPVYWLLADVTPGLEQPEGEVVNLSACTAEIKNAWSNAFSPTYGGMRWYFIKHRYKFPLQIYQCSYYFALLAYGL